MSHQSSVISHQSLAMSFRELLADVIFGPSLFHSYIPQLLVMRSRAVSWCYLSAIFRPQLL